MKNKFTLISMLIFLVLSIPLSFAQQRDIKPVEFEKISERLYQIPGGRGARGGMYIGDNGVLLIDAKMDENSVDAVINKISEITDKPIKYLVNTHSDGDHLGKSNIPDKTTAYSLLQRRQFLRTR